MAHIILLTTVDPSGDSGQNIYSLNIAREFLTLNQHQVSLVLPEPESDLEFLSNNNKKHNIYYIPKKDSRSLLWNLSIQPKIISIIREVHAFSPIDVVVSTLRPPILPLAMLTSVYDMKYILLVEGEIDNEVEHILDSKLAGSLMTLVSALQIMAADTIFIAYEELRPWVESRLICPKPNIIHQPHGVNTNLLDVPIPDPDELCSSEKNGELVVGYVGSFKKYHELDILIRTVNDLSEDIPIVLRLIGYGPEYDNCTKLASKLGIADSVEFIGFVDNNELNSYIQDCDLMYGIIDPNRSGSPMKVYEYLAAGRPVLTYSSSEFSFLAEYRCGVTVNSISESAIASAISEFYELDNHEKHKRMINARRYIISEGYTWAEFVQNIIKSADISPD